MNAKYYGSGIGAVLLLCSCQGPSQAPLAPAHVASGAVLPSSNLGKENLVYVDAYQTGVIVYSYNGKSLKYVGFLDAPVFGEGECEDKAGNVFITAGTAIYEYAHGGSTPINLLEDPYANALNCAVDPTTGNLAVVGYPVEGGSYGVAIFKKARGNPTFYADAGFGDYECGYDNKGNLYIAGYVYSGRLNFASLSQGGSTFTNITLDQSFRAAGDIQWDGKHLAVGDEYAATIYQFDINGSTGTEVGTTSLQGSGTVLQFYVAGNKVFVPSTVQTGVDFLKVYDYPAGGNATSSLDVANAVGAVLSKPSRL